MQDSIKLRGHYFTKEFLTCPLRIRRNFLGGYRYLSSTQINFPKQLNWLLHACPTNDYGIFVCKEWVYCGNLDARATNEHLRHFCGLSRYRKVVSNTTWLSRANGRVLLLDRTTSSGLVKHLSTKESAFLVSPEIYDVLNKLLKNDEDNASGDAMLLCKLFSGEPCSYNYSTERTRDIPSNAPFSILGCTQIPNIAKLIARMDNGQGLVAAS